MEIYGTNSKIITRNRLSTENKKADNWHCRLKKYKYLQGDYNMFTTFEQQHNYYLEQDEPQVFAYDWNGKEIYYGDRYYECDGDYVLEDDLEKYAKEVLAPVLMTAGE